MKEVTMVNVAKLRPSSLPKKNQCIHWENAGESSVYSDRGNKIDEYVDAMLGGKGSVEDISYRTPNDSEEFKAAEWVARKAREILKDENDV